MLVSVLTFLLVLVVLVMGHELGHFLVAKKVGIKVLEFGFGIPPKLWGKMYKGTLYSLNLLPFGGFVRLLGEDADAEQGSKLASRQDSFVGKSKKARAAVVTAGVISNLLLAFVAFSIVYWALGVPRESGKVKILDVESSSPAQTAGVLPGDEVVTIDGLSVATTTQFITLVAEKKGAKTTLVVRRDGEDRKFSIVPRKELQEGQGALGVVISSSEIYYPPFYLRPFYGVYYGFSESWLWSKNIVIGLGTLLRDLLTGHVPKGITGPVGVAAIVAENTKQGGLAVLHLLGILSVNLAVINILPFPGLDGGRLLFIFLESVVKKETLQKVEKYFHLVGAYLLFGLLGLITLSDVRRLITAGSLSGFLDSLMK